MFIQEQKGVSELYECRKMYGIHRCTRTMYICVICKDEDPVINLVVTVYTKFSEKI